MDSKSKETDNKIAPLVEWAVFGHLDKKTDLELILLKGHLLVETILEAVIKRNCSIDLENYSFHRKISILDNIAFSDEIKKEFIISSLMILNRLRNKLAHEFHFDIANGEFEIWASNILQNLVGEKFSKYTFRTKIIHAFSILTKNMLEMEISN